MDIITRREAIKRTLLSVAAVSLGSELIGAGSTTAAPTKASGRIKQSVSRWCFGKIELAEFADICVELGLPAIDLLSPNEWKTVMDKGLDVSMPQAGDIPLERGFNNLDFHSELITKLEVGINRVAEAGLDKLICFSGNRCGVSDEQGLDNSMRALERVIPIAERCGVTLIMELLNSYGHTDYLADHTAWGVELCKRAGSDNFKLLYDIYHMQIMEGNIITTIKDNIDYIAHFHTGGNPGRAEIDDSQEIYYPAVMRAIAETGFSGYVGHEFVPKGPYPISSLAEAIKICDI